MFLAPGLLKSPHRDPAKFRRARTVVRFKWEETMSWNTRSLCGSILGMALIANPCGAQESQSTAGDKINRAVESFEKGAKQAGEAIRGEYHKARASIHSFNVSARVYSRLHWDKDLAGADVEVQVLQDGTATLTGTVGDVKAKAKAVLLTRDTVGVGRVIDQLVVKPVTTDTPADVKAGNAKP
jgi:BON domain